MRGLVWGFVFLLGGQAFAFSESVECLQQALSLKMEDAAATVLCSGSTDAKATIACYEAAKEQRFIERQAAMLCSGASSNAPLECAKEAKQVKKLFWGHIAYLCGRPTDVWK